MDRQPTDRTDTSTARRHLTTVVLEQRPDGTWRATQHGVAVEGRGETAADAAAAYCRRVEDGE